MDEESVTIRPDGAYDSSGDATVILGNEDDGLWLLEGGDRNPFFGELQDIVDAWAHA